MTEHDRRVTGFSSDFTRPLLPCFKMRTLYLSLLISVLKVSALLTCLPLIFILPRIEIPNLSNYSVIQGFRSLHPFFKMFTLKYLTHGPRIVSQVHRPR